MQSELALNCDEMKFSVCLDCVEVTDSIIRERSHQETVKALVCLKWLDKSALTKEYLFICDLRRDFDRKRHSKEYRQMTESFKPVENRNTLLCAYKAVQCKASRCSFSACYALNIKDGSFYYFTF